MDEDCSENACLNQGTCDTGSTCAFDLPVELTSFSATVEGSSVVLQWTTASEINNAGFHIERRAVAPPSDWTALGFVQGHGNTAGENSYNFTAIDLDVGVHSFRLKQVDYDGAFTYSAEVEAAVTVPGLFVLEPAYPNPFNPSTTIRFAVSREETVVVTLYDASGRAIRELYRGRPQPNELQALLVDGEGLASGTYHVNLTGEGFSANERISLVK